MSTSGIGPSRPIFQSPTFTPQEIDSRVKELSTLYSRGDYDGIIERAPQILESIRVCRRAEDRMVEDDVEAPYNRAELKTYCALVEAFLKTNRFQDAKETAEIAITVYDGVPLFTDEAVEYFYNITKARLSNLLATACFSLAAWGPVAEREENIEIGIEESEIAYNIIGEYLDTEPDAIFDDNLLRSIYLNQVKSWAANALETKRELDQLAANGATVDEITTTRKKFKNQLDQALVIANTALEEYQPFDRTLTQALQGHKRAIIEAKERYFPRFDVL